MMRIASYILLEKHCDAERNGERKKSTVQASFGLKCGKNWGTTRVFEIAPRLQKS